MNKKFVYQIGNNKKVETSDHNFAVILWHFPFLTLAVFLFTLPPSLHSAFISFQLFRFFLFLFPSTLLFLYIYIYIYILSFIFPSILLFLFRYFPLILSGFPYNFPPIFPSSSLFCFFPLIPHLTQNVPCDRRRYIFWLCNMNRWILQHNTVTRYAVQFSMILGAFAKLRKATIRFVMSVCLTFYPHGTTRLPMDGFSFH